MKVALSGVLLVRELLQRRGGTNFIIYLLSSVVSSIMPFLALPLIARALGVEEFGQAAWVAVLVSLAGPFIGLSVHGAIYRSFFTLPKDELAVYVFNAVLILSLSTVAAFGAAMLIFEFVPFLDKWRLLTWLAILIGFSSFLGQIYLTLMQLQGRAFAYGLFQVGRAMLQNGIAVYLVVFVGAGWLGVAWGMLFAYFSFAMLGALLLLCEKQVSFAFNYQHLSSLIKFGVPVIPAALKDAIFSVSDRIVLSAMVGIAALGVYSVAVQLASVILLFVGSFNSAFSPWFFKRLLEVDEAGKVGVVRLTYLLFLLVLIFSGAWGVCAIIFLSLFFSAEFQSGRAAVFWLSAAFAVSGMHTLIVSYIYVSGRTGRYAFVAFATIIFGLIANVWLVDLYGIVGAAQATFLTYVFIFLLTWGLVNRVFPMPWFVALKKRQSPRGD